MWKFVLLVGGLKKSLDQCECDSGFHFQGAMDMAFAFFTYWLGGASIILSKDF